MISVLKDMWCYILSHEYFCQYLYLKGSYGHLHVLIMEVVDTLGYDELWKEFFN